MANQDILYRMWIRSGNPTKSVTIRSIGSFATINQRDFVSRTSRGISRSGIDYAVLKFILEYTQPVGWPPGIWDRFILATDNYRGNYAIWRRYSNLVVNIQISSSDSEDSDRLSNDQKIHPNESTPSVSKISTSAKVEIKHPENTPVRSSKRDSVILIFGLFIIGIVLIVTTGILPITQTHAQVMSETCVGDCRLGQIATDGRSNSQKFSVNRVFYLNRPYFDPGNPTNNAWYTGDWILLDVSVTSTDPKKTASIGTGELTGPWGQRYLCFPGGYGGAGIELSDVFDREPKPGATLRGNISCVIEPGRERPTKYEYGFENWYGEGQHAVFSIDQFVPLDYNSIKDSLKGDKPP
jgi:hypothetical protein